MITTTGRMVLILLVIVSAIVITTGIAWMLETDPMAPGNWSGHANEAIGPWRVTLMLGRWALWVLLWWRWEQVGQWLFKGGEEVRSSQRQYWSGMRKRMMGGIAAVEIIILISNLTGD